MQRGEIWLINLDPTIGSEIRKMRLAIIVSSNLIGILPLKVVVPLTEWNDRYASAPCLGGARPKGDKHKSCASQAWRKLYGGI